MTQHADDTIRSFLQAVFNLGNGDYVSAKEIGKSLYGSDPIAQLISAKNIADECKSRGLANVSISYDEISLTPKGYRFIGEE